MTAAELRKAAQQERARRQRVSAGQPNTSFTPEKVLHAGQRAAAADSRHTVVLNCGRRWGKSIVACFKAFQVALSAPGVTCVLVGATQGSISRNLWRPLKEMDRDHGLGAVFLKGVEGWSATLPNGSQVILIPVDTEDAADKVRGAPKVAFVCVDEAQRYKKSVLDYLVLDVIKAMFIDVRAAGGAAQLWLMGTPNPAGKIGTLWTYMNRPGVGVHKELTVYDNDKLGSREKIEQVVDEMLIEEGQTRESVWYRREILAEWVVDLALRVYNFDDDRNVYDVLPTLTTYAIIGDIGVRDADALGLVGWRDDDPVAYLVREEIARGQDTLDLGDKLGKMIEEFHPILVALDGGGLGLKVIMTLQKLFPGLPIRAVNKPPVNLQVKALNDRLRRGFKCRRASKLYAEVRNPTWVNGLVNGKIEENGHSDIVPSMRYMAVELAHLLPDAPGEMTEEERKRKAYLESVRRGERAAKAERAKGLTYDPSEFEEDVPTDLYDGY